MGFGSGGLPERQHLSPPAASQVRVVPIWKQTLEGAPEASKVTWKLVVAASTTAAPTRRVRPRPVGV
jgi:hypothetical protein